MLTLADVINAIEKNGLKKVKGSYITYDYDGTPNGGCAFGQATINLDIKETYDDGTAHYEPMTLSHMIKDAGVLDFPNRVYSMNDSTRWGLKRIAKELREEFANELETIIHP